MLHIDYVWDLSPAGLILDRELPIQRLGWKEGDFFRLVEDSDTGVKKLIKLNNLETFILKGTEDGGS